MVDNNTNDNSSEANPASTSEITCLKVVKKVTKKNHTPAYRVPSIKEKINMIERIENGEYPSALALEYGIREYSVRRIYRRKEDIYAQSSVLQTHQGSVKRMRYTGIEESKFETVLFDWYTQQKEAGVTVTGTCLKNMAIEISTALGRSNNFKASNGWLQGFKKRHGIGSSEVKSQEETKPSLDSSACKEFVTMLHGFFEIGSYSMDNVYNADETIFFWRRLVKSSTHRIMDKLTLMVSVNATGTHKIPLFALGSDEHSLCLKKLKVLPIHYLNHSTDNMDKRIFLHWFKDIFIPSVNTRNEGRPEKIVLILRNSSFYPSPTELRDIAQNCEVILLPSNVPDSIQPVNQGIGETLKKGYHMLFCKDLILHKNNKEINVVNYLKRWNLLKCFITLAHAWQNVTSNTISRAWKNILNNRQAENDIEDHTEDIQSLVNAAFSKDFSGEDMIKFINIFTNDECEIMDSVMRTEFMDDDENDLANVENTEISANEAYKALCVAENWLLTRSDTEQEWLPFLSKAKELAGNVALQDNQLTIFSKEDLSE